MMRIKKVYIIALIFVLGRVWLCPNLSYSATLRPQLQFKKTKENSIGSNAILTLTDIFLHEYPPKFLSLAHIWRKLESGLPKEKAELIKGKLELLSTYDNTRYQEMKTILKGFKPDLRTRASEDDKIKAFESFIKDAMQAIGEIENLFKKSGVKNEDFLDSIETAKNLLHDVISDEVRKSTFDFNKTIAKTKALVFLGKAGKPLILEEDIEIIETFDVEIETMYADRFKLRTVVLNLLKNAGEAMPDGGQLRIETKLEGNKVLIIVSDTGMGIPKNKLEKIFEPHYSTKETMGVGLAICKKIVKQHNGTIDVQSELGKGTTFTVKLPVLPSNKGLTAKSLFQALLKKGKMGLRPWQIKWFEMIDKVGAGGGKDILYVGPNSSKDAMLIATCASLESQVDTVQPDSYASEEDQHTPFLERLEEFIAGIKKCYDINLTGERIDTETYRDDVRKLSLKPNRYSHIFLLSVLDSVGLDLSFTRLTLVEEKFEKEESWRDKDFMREAVVVQAEEETPDIKREILDKIFLTAKHNASIVISSYTYPVEEEIDFLKKYAKEKYSYKIKIKQKFEIPHLIKDDILNIYELKLLKEPDANNLEDTISGAKKQNNI